MTPPLVAAQLLFHVYQQENIEDMIVAELGIGTGMLMSGLIYIGAFHTLGL
jgi:predicted RNA methylase